MAIPVRSGLWRQDVLSSVERMALEIEVRTLEGPATHAGLLARAGDHLADAKKLAQDSLNPVEWWTGSQIEAAWSDLRLAEECLLRATPDDFALLEIKATSALGHAAKASLSDSDPRVTALKGAVGAKDLTSIRELTVQVTQAAHLISDQGHREQRSFRNQLRLISVLLILLAAFAVVGLSVVPGIATLIPRPKGLGMTPALLLCFGMGALGALFSAVPSLSQMPSQSSPFNTAREQAILKVVIGAWSAIIGLMVVAAGINSTITGDATTVPGFAIVSALFGAQQEALTRFADHKAAAMAPGV